MTAVPHALLVLDLIFALLVTRLGAQAYAVRVEAAAGLRELGPLAIPCLDRAAAGDPDPEVRRAAAMLAEDWRNTWRPTAAPMPWLDMLPLDYPERNAVISRLLYQANGGYGYGTAAEDWPEYRTATLLLVAELRAAGWTRPRVVALLDAMALREAEYRRRQPQPPE